MRDAGTGNVDVPLPLVVSLDAHEVEALGDPRAAGRARAAKRVEDGPARGVTSRQSQCMSAIGFAVAFVLARPVAVRPTPARGLFSPAEPCSRPSAHSPAAPRRRSEHV